MADILFIGEENKSESGKLIINDLTVDFSAGDFKVVGLKKYEL